MIRRIQWLLAVLLLGLAAGADLVLAATELSSLLETVRSVSNDGRESQEARRAWRELVKVDAGEITRILEAIDGATPQAANWLRAAVDTVAERALAADQELPQSDLRRFVRDRGQDPRARRLAFEWLVRVNRGAADQLIGQMLHDPSVELRRDAVARLLADADRRRSAADATGAVRLYRDALDGARDEDQIKEIVSHLRQLDQQVNLPKHFGFLMHWQVIGPFDNTDRKGFDAVFPPEQTIDLDASHPGKHGPVRWQVYATQDDYGLVDLNEPFGPLKETVGYAITEFTSATQQQVELRLGCKNAWKLWLNGQLLFGRDEYHRGMQLDQYRMPATLNAGRNMILLKVCQNEEVESWTVEWQFQIRVCDAVGSAILTTSRPADP